jgi:hypothetical protein
MWKAKMVGIKLEKPTEGLIKAYKNKDLVRMKIDEENYRMSKMRK